MNNTEPTPNRKNYRFLSVSYLVLSRWGIAKYQQFEEGGLMNFNKFNP